MYRKTFSFVIFQEKSWGNRPFEVQGGG